MKWVWSKNNHKVKLPKLTEAASSLPGILEVPCLKIRLTLSFCWANSYIVQVSAMYIIGLRYRRSVCVWGGGGGG